MRLSVLSEKLEERLFVCWLSGGKLSSLLLVTVRDSWVQRGGYFLLFPSFLPRRGREAGDKWAIGEWMVFVPNVRVANEDATWQSTNQGVRRRSRRAGAANPPPIPRFRAALSLFSPCLGVGSAEDGWAFCGRNKQC